MLSAQKEVWGNIAGGQSKLVKRFTFVLGFQAGPR